MILEIFVKEKICKKTVDTSFSESLGYALAKN
jgi:hypothetical protein